MLSRTPSLRLIGYDVIDSHNHPIIDANRDGSLPNKPERGRWSVPIAKHQMSMARFER